MISRKVEKASFVIQFLLTKDAFIIGKSLDPIELK